MKLNFAGMSRLTVRGCPIRSGWQGFLGSQLQPLTVKRPSRRRPFQERTSLHAPTRRRGCRNRLQLESTSLATA